MSSCHGPACALSLGTSLTVHFAPFPALGRVVFTEKEGFAWKSSPKPEAPLFRNHHVPRGSSISILRVSLPEMVRSADRPWVWGSPRLGGLKCCGPPSRQMGRMPPALVCWVDCKPRRTWGHPLPTCHPQERENTVHAEGLPEG